MANYDEDENVKTLWVIVRATKIANKFNITLEIAIMP